MENSKRTPETPYRAAVTARMSRKTGKDTYRYSDERRTHERRDSAEHEQNKCKRLNQKTKKMCARTDDAVILLANWLVITILAKFPSN